ncbi:hypothetical protein [Flindersiella endophytica]
MHTPTFARNETTTMTPEDHFARLSDAGPWQPAKPDRPVMYRLDDDGAGLTVELPGPRVLARLAVNALSYEVLRRNGSAYTRPRGTDTAPAQIGLDALARDLRAWLSALPDRPDAKRPYKDTRALLAAAHPDTVRAYLSDVARYVRGSAPTWRKPPVVREVMTAEQKRARHRDYMRKARAAERAACDSTLEVHAAAWVLAARELHPGAAVKSTLLHQWYVKAFTDEENGSPLLLGRSAFHRIARACALCRRRSGGATYLFPATVSARSKLERRAEAGRIVEDLLQRENRSDQKEATVFSETELMERTADKLAEKLLARMDARQRPVPLQATGTHDASVVSLPDRRARR